jgi:hypothetical protein
MKTGNKTMKKKYLFGILSILLGMAVFGCLIDENKKKDYGDKSSDYDSGESNPEASYRITISNNSIFNVEHTTFIESYTLNKKNDFNGIKPGSSITYEPNRYFFKNYPVGIVVITISVYGENVELSIDLADGNGEYHYKSQYIILSGSSKETLKITSRIL